MLTILSWLWETLCHALPKRQAAAEHFAIATTMSREMDMRYWLEQVEAGRDT